MSFEPDIQRAAQYLGATESANGWTWTDQDSGISYCCTSSVEMEDLGVRLAEPGAAPAPEIYRAWLKLMRPDEV